jgi:hypothetical protein
MVRERLVVEREGEDCGPIDWTHPLAKDMPECWRDAEQHPDRYMLAPNGAITLKRIIAIRMYDGWPYWEPRPAILFEGPLGPEWNFFDSYGIHATSVVRRREEGPDAG